MKSWLVNTSALAVAVAVAGACVDAEPADHPASASGTTTSSSSNGGSAGAGGAEGGTGGIPACDAPFPGNGPACNDCLVENCCAEATACKADHACNACVTTAVCGAIDPRLYTAFQDCAFAHCGQPSLLCAPNPACDAMAPVPSGGSCFTMTKDDTCNPFTNEGCMEDDVCLSNANSGFACNGLVPLPATQDVCEPCDLQRGVYCGPSLYCTRSRKCARYCCNDGDCGAGICRFDQISSAHPSLGLCYEAESFD
jgi:hypothetical protein